MRLIVEWCKPSNEIWVRSKFRENRSCDLGVCEHNHALTLISLLAKSLVGAIIGTMRVRSRITQGCEIAWRPCWPKGMQMRWWM